MRPLYDFVVEVPKLFNDTVEVNGTQLFKDTRWDDFEGRISYGTIKAIPLKANVPSKVKVGDTLVFHHHVNQQPDKFGLCLRCSVCRTELLWALLIMNPF